MLMRRYEREIKELRQELAMHDAINGRGHTVYEPYTPVQRSELRVGVKEFLEVRADNTHIPPLATRLRPWFRTRHSLELKREPLALETAFEPDVMILC
jgi:kinesin family protein 6/9